MTIEIIDSNLILSKVLRLSIFICSCRLLSLDNFISQVLIVNLSEPTWTYILSVSNRLRSRKGNAKTRKPGSDTDIAPSLRAFAIASLLSYICISRVPFHLHIHTCSPKGKKGKCN